MPNTSRSVLVATVLAAMGALLAGCDPLPPDAIRGPRRIVAGSGGVCALWDDAPMRCWGDTPYTSMGEKHGFDVTRPRYARPSLHLDASDVVFGPIDRYANHGGCVIDRRGALACTTASRGRRVFPALRSARSMRDLRSPVVTESRACVLARTDGEREEAVWCRERASVPYDPSLGDTLPPVIEDGWERLDLGEVESLALASDRLCARLRSGHVRCLDFSNGQIRDVAGITGAVQLVLGHDFGCARDAHGEVRCFGEGAAGQLGDGESKARTEARPVPLQAPATDLAAGYERACAIVNGAPICWGLLRRELELPAVVARTPERVAGVGDLGRLALGDDFTCATRIADGTVRCWGFDADGALGDGSMLPSPGCSREGIRATSAERERPAPPTVVRTGDAGPHPRWRAPLRMFAAFSVLAPLALAIGLARASIRRLALSTSAARDALYGQAILTALLVPVALGRVMTGVLALWNGRLQTIHLDRGMMGPVAVATLAPAAALALAIVLFLRLGQTRDDRLSTVARRGAFCHLLLAAPLFIAAMVATPRVNESAREELVYLVRDVTFSLDASFAGQLLLFLAWLVVAIAYALFTSAWVTEQRRTPPAQS